MGQSASVQLEIVPCAVEINEYLSIDGYIVEKSFNMDHLSRSPNSGNRILRDAWGCLGKRGLTLILELVSKYSSDAKETHRLKMQFFSNALVAGLLLCKIPATRGHLDTPFGLVDLVHVRRLPYYLDIWKPHKSISSLAPTTVSRSEGALVKGAFSKLSFLLSSASSWFCCILRQDV